MKKIRAIIVDDEPFARLGLRRELTSDDDIEVIAECANGREAVKAIKEQQPDLVFLDLKMPELDGLGVVETVGIEEMPTLVFVTAYDEFALKAFEIHALDYVLKPFDSERLQKALRRAKQQINRERPHQFSARLRAFLEDAQSAINEAPPQKFLERVVVKSTGKIFFLKVEEIDWMEAADNYVLLHIGKKSHLVHGTMSKLEGHLNPEKFLRVHRSTIVNVARIKELHPLFHGEYVILLNDGTKLTSSRGYRDKLQRLLENSF